MWKLMWRLLLMVFGIGVGVTVQAKTASKAYATSVRVDKLAQAHANLNGQVQGIAAQLAGITFSGTGNLNASALKNLNNAINTQFLAGLSKLPHQTTSNAGGAGNDAFTGPYWGSGERGYINTDSNSIDGLANAVNILQGNLQSNGFQS